MLRTSVHSFVRLTVSSLSSLTSPKPLVSSIRCVDRSPLASTAFRLLKPYLTCACRITSPAMSVRNFSQSKVKDLTGRTAVVTGATGGIGFEVAKALALANARVILTARKDDQGAQACATIKEQNPSANIQFISNDLGNLRETKEMADKIRSQEERLDFIVADASVAVNQFGLTSDNLDRHMTVTHFGHFVLINHLYPLIRKTSQIPNSSAPRIVTVSSELHRTAPSSVQFRDLHEINEGGKELGPNQLYSRAKLANILFTKYGLVERVIQPNHDNVWAFSVHPGAVHTGQQEQFKEAYGIWGSLLKNITVPFMRDPEKGSLSTLWALTSDQPVQENWQGFYFKDPGQPGKESRQAEDETLGANLWDLSERIVRDKLGQDGLLSWQ